MKVIKVTVTLSQGAASIYGGQKWLKRVILPETFSRSSAVFLPLMKNTPKYGQAIFEAKATAISFIGRKWIVMISSACDTKA
jgi:hypothetical protein